MSQPQLGILQQTILGRRKRDPELSLQARANPPPGKGRVPAQRIASVAGVGGPQPAQPSERQTLLGG